MGTKDGNNDYEADNTKEGEEGGGYTAVKDGNGDEDDKDDDEEDVMDVLPPLVARRVKRLKCLNTERERVTERHLKERAALEMNYSDLS